MSDRGPSGIDRGSRRSARISSRDASSQERNAGSKGSEQDDLKSKGKSNSRTDEERGQRDEGSKKAQKTKNKVKEVSKRMEEAGEEQVGNGLHDVRQRQPKLPMDIDDILLPPDCSPDKSQLQEQVKERSSGRLLHYLAKICWICIDLQLLSRQPTDSQDYWCWPMIF